MAQSDINEYIQSMRNKGIDDSKIKETLKRNGYTDLMIDQAMPDSTDTNTPPTNNGASGNVNVLAIVALILSFLFSPAGLILAIIALVQFKKDPSLSGKGLAIAALVISILFVLMLPALIAIGALAYFGAMSPDNFLPERCTGPAGLDCIDKAVISQDGTLLIPLKNNLGYDISLNQQITTSGGCTSSALTTVNDGSNFPIMVENNEQINLKIDCGPQEAGRFQTGITLNYANPATQLTHTALISITGLVR